MYKHPLYVFMLSLHGLVRGREPELGRDADTGGQITYVLDLARALGRHPDVKRVDLLTRLIDDPQVSQDYAQPEEPLGKNAKILRLPFGPKRYLRKELLWDHLDQLVDRCLHYFREQGQVPDVIHSHYADAGYVGCHLSQLLGIPQVHTGHSLGRCKRQRLLDSGRKEPAIERQFNFVRRIEAEEQTLKHADLVITSTRQERDEQYAVYENLLCRRLGVTQCNIAHALEKTKYLYSALYWRENEERYHFSCQYTADLIAMNTADFIITSTYQEIAGTESSIGQYESYCRFTMPGLYRVVSGIDLFDPKFNIVSPGANPDIFFAHTAVERRLKGLWPDIENLIYGPADAGWSRGVLADREKPLIFTLARMDHIKNLTGLVEWYGQSARLRGLANLLVIGGHVDPGQSSDHEEQAQIRRMHELMDRHGLDGELRWVGTRLDKNLAGELYRRVADSRGVFVQPALFEAFGLTLIEAMATGLPTFATCHGGPLEIIQDNRSGFHIDPNKGAESADRIAGFLDLCAAKPKEWERISKGALARVEKK